MHNLDPGGQFSGIEGEPLQRTMPISPFPFITSERTSHALVPFNFLTCHHSLFYFSFHNSSNVSHLEVVLCPCVYVDDVSQQRVLSSPGAISDASGTSSLSVRFFGSGYAEKHRRYVGATC